MSLSGEFHRPEHEPEPSADRGTSPAKRDAPFSLRLNAAERARLTEDAGDAPIGSYIKERLFGDHDRPAQRRRSGLPVRDREALARALALLGRSRIANNLNQLAHVANIGALPMTPETEGELLEALRGVQEIRRLLVTALGLKAGGPT